MEKLVLKSGRDRSVNFFHPWIFSGGLKLWPQADNGEIVEVCNDKMQTLGFGFFSPNSQISCRIFHFGADAYDFTLIDYWREKINLAYELRQRVVNLKKTNAYRLIHAEGDFLPGLIVDVYDKFAVMQLLVKGTEHLLPIFVQCLEELGFAHIYFKNKSSSQEIEGVVSQSRWLTDTEPGLIEIQENRLKFIIDVETGQKTGFFLDQRENRGLLMKYAKGKKVLNTFCYTGGFSVYAFAGEASEVHSVDISKDAVKLCEKTVERNFGVVKHKAIVADCFEYLKKTEERYDIIVLDPPAFAKNARSVPNATRGYKELNLMAFKNILPQGMVMTYSCSQHISRDLFQKVVFGAAADAKRNVRILKHLQQPPDHPVNIYHPESEYLKGLLLWVE